jgi:hypothetical protein
MAVGRGRLARHDELKPAYSVAVARDWPDEGRVFQNQDPPLGFLRREQPPRLHQQRPDLVVAPLERHRLGLRLGRHEPFEHFPQGRQVARAQPGVELLALGVRRLVNNLVHGAFSLARVWPGPIDQV